MILGSRMPFWGHIPIEERKQKRTEYRAKSGRQWTPGSLTEQVFHGLLPTPAVMDATNEGRKLTDGKSISFKTGIRYGIRLPQMANNQMLPTPMAQNRETTLEKTLERKEKYS